jgi:protein-S-isoprenylcysteine O-methyltransferase Ste14
MHTLASTVSNDALNFIAHSRFAWLLCQYIASLVDPCNSWKKFSPDLEIAENHQLITVGPYKYVRHPMYTQFLLWAIFQGLLLANSFVLVFGIVSWVLFYCVRMPAEEKMMLNKFGKEYDLYALKPGRLFPKIK